MPIAQRNLDGRGRRNRVGYRTRHHLNGKERRLWFLLDRRAKPWIATPCEHQVRVDVVTPGNLRDRHPRDQRLSNNLALLLMRPSPSRPSPSRHRITPSCPLIRSGHLLTLTNLQAWNDRQPPRKGGMGERIRLSHKLTRTARRSAPPPLGRTRPRGEALHDTRYAGVASRWDQPGVPNLRGVIPEALWPCLAALDAGASEDFDGPTPRPLGAL